MAVYKFAKILTRLVIVGLLAAILYVLAKGSSRSGYAELNVTPGPNVRRDPKDLFAIKPNMECTPGPGAKAAYFTVGLTPGGLCGDSDMVRDQMRDYAISDGIGGSLLDK